MIARATTNRDLCVPSQIRRLCFILSMGRRSSKRSRSGCEENKPEHSNQRGFLKWEQKEIYNGTAQREWGVCCIFLNSMKEAQYIMCSVHEKSEKYYSFFKPWKDCVKKASGNRKEVWGWKRVMEKLQDNWLSSTHRMQDLFPADTKECPYLNLFFLAKKKRLPKSQLVTWFTECWTVIKVFSQRLKNCTVYLSSSSFIFVMVINASAVVGRNRSLL